MSEEKAWRQQEGEGPFKRRLIIRDADKTHLDVRQSTPGMRPLDEGDRGSVEEQHYEDGAVYESDMAMPNWASDSIIRGREDEGYQIDDRRTKKDLSDRSSKEFNPPDWRPRVGDRVRSVDHHDADMGWTYQDHGEGEITGDYGNEQFDFTADASPHGAPGARTRRYSDPGTLTLSGAKLPGEPSPDTHAVASGYQQGDHGVLADSLEDAGHSEVADRVRKDPHLAAATARDIRDSQTKKSIPTVKPSPFAARRKALEKAQRIVHIDRTEHNRDRYGKLTRNSGHDVMVTDEQGEATGEGVGFGNRSEPHSYHHFLAAETTRDRLADDGYDTQIIDHGLQPEGSDIYEKAAPKKALDHRVQQGDEVVYTTSEAAADNFLNILDEHGYDHGFQADALDNALRYDRGTVVGEDDGRIMVHSQGPDHEEGSYRYLDPQNTDIIRRTKMAADPNAKVGDTVSWRSTDEDIEENRQLMEQHGYHPTMINAISNGAFTEREGTLVDDSHEDGQLTIHQQTEDGGRFHYLDPNRYDIRKKMALDPGAKTGDEVDIDPVENIEQGITPDQSNERYEGRLARPYVGGLVPIDEDDAQGVVHYDPNEWEITRRQKHLKSLRARYKANNWGLDDEDMDEDIERDKLPDLWTEEEQRQWDFEDAEQMYRDAVARQQNQEPNQDDIPTGNMRKKSGGPGDSSENLGRRGTDQIATHDPVENLTRFPASPGQPVRRIRHSGTHAPSLQHTTEQYAAQGGEIVPRTKATPPMTDDEADEDDLLGNPSLDGQMWTDPNKHNPRLVIDLSDIDSLDDYLEQMDKELKYIEAKARKPKDPTEGYGRNEPGPEWTPSKVGRNEWDPNSEDGLQYEPNTDRYVDENYVHPREEPVYEYHETGDPAFGQPPAEPEMVGYQEVPDVMENAQSARDFVDPRSIEKAIQRTGKKSGDPGSEGQGSNMNPAVVHYAEPDPQNQGAYRVTHQLGDNSKAPHRNLYNNLSAESARREAESETAYINSMLANRNDVEFQEGRGFTEPFAHTVDQTKKAISAYQSGLGADLVPPPQQGSLKKRKLGQKSIKAPMVGGKATRKEVLDYDDSRRADLSSNNYGQQIDAYSDVARYEQSFGIPASSRDSTDNTIRAMDIRMARSRNEDPPESKIEDAAQQADRLNRERHGGEYKQLADGQKGDFSGVHKDVLGRVVCWFNGKRTPCPRKKKPDKSKKKPGGRYPPAQEQEEEVDQAQAQEEGIGLPEPSYLAPSQTQVYHTPVAPGDLECRFYVYGGVLKPVQFYTVPALVEINELIDQGLPSPVNAAHLRLINLFNGFPPAPVTGYLGLDLSMSEALTLQFLETCLKSQQEKMPMAFPGLTPLVVDPSVEFGGNFKICVSASHAIPFGAEELILQEQSALIVTDIEQINTQFIIHMQQMEEPTMLPTEPDGTETTEQDMVEEEATDPVPS